MCAFTKDGRDLQISRVVLRIATGDVDDAGTDDSVAVTIGGAGAGSFGGTTWLDHSIDDFERNSTHDYDLVRLDGIAELGDIHSLVFFKQENDDWCIKGVTMLVNNVEVFSTNFGESCEWIRGNLASGGYVPNAQLRADPHWATFAEPLPALTFNPDGTITAVFTIPRPGLEARIEAMVGNAIHGTDAYWGHLHGKAVEGKMYTDSVANIDLDLAADVFASDPEVDIDFNLVAGAHQDNNGNWNLDLSTTNVRTEVDLAWWENLLDVVVPCGPIVSVIEDEGIPFCLAHLSEEAANQISAGFPRLQQSFGVGSKPQSLTAFFDVGANLIVTAILPTLSSPTSGPGSVDPNPHPYPRPTPDPKPQVDSDPAPCAGVSDMTPDLRRRGLRIRTCDR